MLEQRLHEELREVFAPSGWVRLQCVDHADLRHDLRECASAAASDGTVRRHWKARRRLGSRRRRGGLSPPNFGGPSVTKPPNTSGRLGVPSATAFTNTMERRRRACLWCAAGPSLAARASMIPSSALSSARWSGTLSSLLLALLVARLLANRAPM